MTILKALLLAAPPLREIRTRKHQDLRSRPELIRVLLGNGPRTKNLWVGCGFRQPQGTNGLRGSATQPEKRPLQQQDAQNSGVTDQSEESHQAFHVGLL